MAIYKEFETLLPVKHEEENVSYVSYSFLPKFLMKRELKAIDQLWKEEEVAQAGVFTAEASKRLDKEQRNSKKVYIHSENNEWIYDMIADIVSLVNASNFKFSLTGFQGPLSYNLYEKGSFFTWHMDIGPGAFSNRKLVLVIQLSNGDEYEGGELQLVTDAIVAPRERGSIAIFPSYVMHRVTPVLSGCRKSLVAHIGGPPFR